MKLLRHGAPGQERPGALAADGTLRDLSGIIGDVTDEFLAPRVLQDLANIELRQLPLVAPGVRLGPCVAGVRNFIGIGLNYRDHAIEVGAAIPREPIVFNKATSCIAGANDDVPLPPGSTCMDWECELAIVISREGYAIQEKHAGEFIAGWCICHDISEREQQLEHGGQWVKGKSFPGFGPLGPWLVTRQTLAQVSALPLWLRVNGETMQSSSTSQMIFSVEQLVAYLSSLMLLRAGDVITTGTPPGVGMSRKPQRYLRAGDQVTLSIDGLGVQQHRIVAHNSPPQ